MNPKARPVWWLAVVMLAASTFAQEVREERDDQDERTQRATKIPTEGFWPTRLMMERIIDRITEDMSGRYDFDDEQLELTRQLLKARIPSFLNENRAEIQTLTNRYFEALLHEEPPTVEDVATWAERVQPLLAEFGEVIEEVTEGMREYLTEDQQGTLDAELAAFQTGTTMAQNKMSVWAAGGYDPETEWIRPGPERRRREREERRQTRAAMDEARREVIEEGASPAAAAAAAAGSQRPQPAEKAPKDEWTVYAEQFIRRYKLNEEQKQKAYAFLHRQQEQRDKYLRRKADEMERVTGLLQKVKTEEERKAALEAYDRLNAPIERVFQQLKDRLNTLPTRAQRKAAAEAGLVEDEGKEKEPPPPDTSPSKEELEKLEELGYTKPPASQPKEPQP